MRVSVCMLSYNHERFIAQALDSVFAQRMAFDFEIVIGVDNSSDRTRGIVQKYVAAYPGCIRPKFYEERVGLKTNFIETLKRCRGDYVAVLSGDDYWTDTYKLQKQADFLDNNLDYVLVGHNALKVQDGSSESTGVPAKPAASVIDAGAEELLVSNPFVASMVMFRNIIHEFPEPYFVTSIEDRPLYFLLAQWGLCRFEPDFVGVYRVHSNSITQQRNTIEAQLNARRELVFNAVEWNKYFGGRYTEQVRESLRLNSYALVLYSLRLGKVGMALYYSQFLQARGVKTFRGRIQRQVIKSVGSLVQRLISLDRWR